MKGKTTNTGSFRFYVTLAALALCYNGSFRFYVTMVVLALCYTGSFSFMLHW
jgi:hypothetical protein